MAKIPIEIEKIKIGEQTTMYQISIIEKGTNWKKTIRCSLSELDKFRKSIDLIISETTTSEILSISNEKAKKIDSALKNDKLCKSCKYRLTSNCITCLIELQSPLERKLFLALKDKYIKFETQYALDWNGKNISTVGKSYDNPINNFKNVLTIPDFYISKKDLKLCIYTDGHTYHERTEGQAQRDKRIDRKLQELGFKVLRYTGKDVNENLDKIVTEIKNWIK